MLIATVLFLAVSTTVVFGLAGPITRQLNIETNLKKAHASYYVSEALQEDVVYRIKNAIDVDDSETLTLGGYTATATVVTNGNEKQVTVEGDVDDRIRTTQTTLVLDSGVGFAFGVQAGEGGFVLENNARIIGNVYSAGPIMGNTNIIEGDAIAAGAGNSIDDIRTFGDMYADTISYAVVDGDAHYVTSISNTTVGGSVIQDPSAQSEEDLPITDTQVASWEAVAEGGTVESCSGEKVIKNSIAIGPIKYTCDVKFEKNADITLLGHVWVEGDLTIENNVVFTIDSSLGDESVVIIADDELNRTSGSTVVMQNNSEYYGSGDPDSYVLILSMNESSENGGSVEAIHVKNNPTGDLLVYAGHGEILIENNVELNEVTAYKIKIKNNAEVRYESGLASLLFDAGPGAGFNLSTWLEVE